MQIVGGQLVAQDCILEAHPNLVGNLLSIALSQRGDSAAVWILRVDVRTTQGFFRLGSLTTVAPTAGDVPARIVGFAACPGAVGWRVVASCSTVGEIADLTISSSQDSSIGTVGVAPNTGGSVLSSNVNVTSWGSALVAAAVTLADTMTNAVLVPLFGARLEAFNATDGWNRVRIGLASAGLFDLKTGGIETARSVHLAVQALPAAGGFTNQAVYAIPSGIGEITAWITYTAGDVGGFPIFHVLWGNGTEEGQDVDLDVNVVVGAAPQARQNFYAQELAATTASGFTYALPIRVPRGATTFRIKAAEAGNTATPGLIAIAIAGGTAR